MIDKILEFIVPKIYAFLILVCLYASIINNFSIIIMAIVANLVIATIILVIYIPSICNNLRKKKKGFCPKCNMNINDEKDEIVNYCPYCGQRIRVFRKHVPMIYLYRIHHLFDKNLINE